MEKTNVVKISICIAIEIVKVMLKLDLNWIPNIIKITLNTLFFILSIVNIKFMFYQFLTILINKKE